MTLVLTAANIIWCRINLEAGKLIRNVQQYPRQKVYGKCTEAICRKIMRKQCLSLIVSIPYQRFKNIQ